MTTDLFKQYLVNGVMLGYDVFELIEKGKNIKNEDDISRIYMEFRIKNEIRDCYFKNITLDEIVTIINNCTGITKSNFTTSLKRKLKNIE